MHYGHVDHKTTTNKAIPTTKNTVLALQRLPYPSYRSALNKATCFIQSYSSKRGLQCALICCKWLTQYPTPIPIRPRATPRVWGVGGGREGEENYSNTGSSSSGPERADRLHAVLFAGLRLLSDSWLSARVSDKYALSCTLCSLALPAALLTALSLPAPPSPPPPVSPLCAPLPPLLSAPSYPVLPEMRSSPHCVLGLCSGMVEVMSSWCE